MINCIQQIGLGVSDIEVAFAWIRKAFGMDVPIFDDEGKPVFMTRYTGGLVQSRRALLAASMSGGSGFEIWQYTSRTPEGPGFTVRAGDLGIFAAKIKAPDVLAAFEELKKRDVELLGGVSDGPSKSPHFFVQDPFKNLYQIAAGEEWFSKKPAVTGGVTGCIIGVSDIDRSMNLYGGVLGYDTVVYDETGVFEDLQSVPGGTDRLRRVLLKTKEPGGIFASLVGPSVIELIQSVSRPAEKIFKKRFWGDLGFIHLCFDVHDMAALKTECEKAGFGVTVDSNDAFDMGQAAGHFIYIEDPDGTLIEFVETYRIPLFKKLGIYLNLKKRDPKKPLPDWMLKALSLGRVKD
ncbi:MAG: VOC family protein [Spirochaetes bacterium]|nr:VOC family protein [Spirochaetota bacterium]